MNLIVTRTRTQLILLLVSRLTLRANGKLKGYNSPAQSRHGILNLNQHFLGQVWVVVDEEEDSEASSDEAIWDFENLSSKGQYSF